MIALLMAGGIALAVSLVGTRFLIEWLRSHRIGQPIRETVTQQLGKAGTPTMGGIAIVAGAVIGYAVAHVRGRVFFTESGIFVLLLVVGAGLVGFLDDFIKIKRERSLGLTSRMKVLGLLVVALGFAWATVARTGVSTRLTFTRFNSFSQKAALLNIDFGRVGWVLWAVFLIMAATNAVNLTDGLDGLAAGAALFSFASFTIIAFWAFRNADVYQVRHALDLAVVAAAMLGACTGFLWWNAHPARIFMGDTGSLAIGAGLAGLALTLNTSLLMPIVGALFVVEAVSVIVQVGVFRVSKGRRVFRMAPIHHHYELGGWHENTVIVRFWIIAGLSTALALGMFYADFTTVPTCSPEQVAKVEARNTEYKDRLDKAPPLGFVCVLPADAVR